MTSRLSIWVIAALLIVVGIAVARGVSGAERTLSGPYEISLFRAGSDYREDRPSSETIAGPFDSRESCRIAITRVRVASGVRHASNKLSEQQVLLIRIAQDLPQHVLADLYGVSQPVISAIRLGKIWRHI